MTLSRYLDGSREDEDNDLTLSESDSASGSRAIVRAKVRGHSYPACQAVDEAPGLVNDGLVVLARGKAVDHAMAASGSTLQVSRSVSVSKPRPGPQRRPRLRKLIGS